MRHYTQLLSTAIAVGVSLCAGPAQAQTDATGHWKGSVQVQAMHVEFVVDIAKGASGELTGTIGLPSQKIKGLPLQKVALDGTTFTFYARADQPFRGTLAADCTVAGDMTIEGLSAPFTMTRAGEGVFEPAPRSSGVNKAVAGVWNGALEANGRQLRLILRIEAQPDGTMLAEMTDVDEGGLRSPVKLVQQGATLTVESVAVPATISGTLNADATELTGTFSQGQASLPLTLRRARP
jgi:hypothetical protein